MDIRDVMVVSLKASHRVSVAVHQGGPETVLLLHGLGCSKETFSPILGCPALTSRTLIIPDLVGFGDSSRPDEFSYGLEDQAMILAAMLNVLRLNVDHVAGHSMGAAVGLLLPDEVSSTVRTFVNVEGNLVSEDCGLLSRRVAAVPYGEFAEDMLPALKRRAAAYGPGRFDFERASALAVYRSADSLVTWSDSGKLLQRFRDLPCRKAYVFGDEHDDMPVLDRLRDVETVRMAHSGHFVMHDNPQEFCACLDRLLERT